MKDLMKEDSTVRNLLKKTWVQKLGLIVIGIVLAMFIFNPFGKAKVIDKVSAKNAELNSEYADLQKDYNSLKKEHNTLLKDTADWRELTEDQKKAALDKVEEDRKKAEAEEKAKEEAQAKAEAERIAAEEKAKQEEADTSQALTEGKVKEMIDYYGIGEGDELTNVSFVNGEIRATIALAPNDMFSPKDIAVNRYSQLSDELLNHEGWDTLTITYPAIGTISMNRNEKETNEYGDFFPSLEIENKLK